MALKHSVYDNDTHFEIDGLTRCVKNVTETKSMLVQYDHNSERFTFEVPRYVDGHDLSLCDTVRVHYINIDKSKRAENKGVYEVTDLQVSPDADDVVICSWLISNNATQLVGTLHFVVQFACTDDGDVVYSWNTARHTGVSITDGIYNGDDLEKEYGDILQWWYQRLFEMTGGNVDLNTGEAVKFWVGTSAEYEQEKDKLPTDCVVFLTDAPAVAERAPSVDEAHTDDGDEEGQVFHFSNTTGFGLYGEKDQGHFKVWSRSNSKGEDACCLVPSKNGKLMLGASDRRFDRVYADKFIGTADKAQSAETATRATKAGYISPEMHYDFFNNITTTKTVDGAGLYFLIIEDATGGLHSETMCVTPTVVQESKTVEGLRVYFTGNGNGGTFGLLTGTGLGAFAIRAIVPIAKLTAGI